MKSQKEIENIVLRLLENEVINEQEQQELKSWLLENPEKANEFTDIASIWTQLDTLREVDQDQVSSQWKSTFGQLEMPENKSRTIWLAALKYAAIFILGCMVAASLLWVQRSNHSKTLLSQVVEVPFGAKSTVILSDGTEVILNAGSQLRYDNRFGEKARRVALTGEAYFKVATNPEKPFMVATPDFTVKAYGTEFNVKSYMDETTTAATLIEGSISVVLNNQSSRRQKELYLKPNEQLILSKNAAATPSVNSASESSPEPNVLTRQPKGKLIISKNIEPQLFTAWVYDKIQVKSVSLKELAIRLERKYNVKIHIEDEQLKELKFTGTLENETIEQVMHALELSSPLKFRIDDREIWLTSTQNS
jgi:ferric-dicitrate binding protein FerR (iron transport regulator)